MPEQETGTANAADMLGQECAKREAVDYAGFPERLLAYFIDAVPFLLLWLLTIYAGFNYFGWGASPRFQLGSKICWILAYIVYMAHFSAYGRVTLGKFLLGIKVLDKNGANLGLGAAYLRAFGYFISAAPISLGYVMALVSPENRALHDYIAGSCVVRIREKSEFTYGLIFSMAMFLCGIFAAVWYYDTFLSPTPQDRAGIQAADQALTALAGLEEEHKKYFGRYTDDLHALISLSPAPAAFSKELIKTLDPESLELAGDETTYYLSARALDRRKTSVRKWR